MAPLQKDKDLSWNFANQIGFGNSPGFVDVIRLYNALHTDHEGGNVSAHATHLVGSALSDPFLSYSAALCGKYFYCIYLLFLILANALYFDSDRSCRTITR